MIDFLEITRKLGLNKKNKLYKIRVRTNSLDRYGTVFQTKELIKFGDLVYLTKDGLVTNKYHNTYKNIIGIAIDSVAKL